MAKQYVNGTSLASESEAQAIALAERLALPYVDVAAHRVDPELFRSMPVEWMLRFGFIPESRSEKFLTVICADPTDVVKLDELELLTGLPLRLKVGSRAAIQEILKKSESSQRVLEEATEEFRIQLVPRTRTARRPLTIDRLTSDRVPDHQAGRLRPSSTPSSAAPRTSTSRRATEGGLIKYRIDGVLLPGHGARSTRNSTRRSSPASRSCPSSTSPRSASRRTAASSCGCAGGRSTSASRSCRPSTARTR